MARDTEALVRAAQEGDAGAFDALVRAFQDLVVAYATSLLADRDLAEDAAQEAFLDAWRFLGALRDPKAFPAWLRRIVFKHCDRITRRRPPRIGGIDAAYGLASPGPSPEEAVEAAEAREALRAAIDLLPEAERQVVLLYYMGDRSQTDVARFLDVTPNAVKTRLYAARRHLRAHMAEIEEGLGERRPSADERFVAQVRRLIQPEALKGREPWMWSPGMGADVWEMFCACVLGDLRAVKRLVERDPSLVRAHYEYRTPLSFAVRENHLDVAAYLLDHGAAEVSLGDPVEMARDRGYDPMLALLERKLHELRGMSAEGEPVAEAIRDYDPDRVRRLLDERPELLRARDGRSNEPIHWAVMTRQIDVIDELVRRGADLDARRADGALPIHLTNGDYDYRGWRDVPPEVTTTPERIYDHLVSLGAEVDLGMAAFKGDEARVRDLLARDPSLANRPSPYNSYYVGCGAPLKNAAAGGHVAIVKLLIEHGADPNLPEEGIAPKGHALYSAVYRGHHEIAELLLEHGAFPNPPVESSADAVWIAIRRGDRRMLDLLGSHGAVMDIPFPLEGTGIAYGDLRASGVGLPLRILAYYGDAAAVAALLEEDPSRAEDPEALEMAAGQGHEDVVRLLLGHAPDLAREVTVSKPREMAELLFAHGMDPNRPDWLRATPLHRFAGSGDVESAALFLDHGADVTARDEEHRSTPLAWAARKGQTRMVELLLRRGAPVELPDDPPWATPLAWAERRGHAETVRLLTEVRRSGALPERSLAAMEALADDLVAAYAGDEPALARVARHFRLERELGWDRPTHEVRVKRLRKGIGEQLRTLRGAAAAGGGETSGRTAGEEKSGSGAERRERARPGGEGPGQRDAPGDSLPLADARLLVARSEGFAGWDDLTASLVEGDQG